MKGILEAAVPAHFKPGEVIVSHVMVACENRFSCREWGEERVGSKTRDMKR